MKGALNNSSILEDYWIIYSTLFQNLLKIYSNKEEYWEAEAGGSQGQEIETIQVNMVKPRLY